MTQKRLWPSTLSALAWIGCSTLIAGCGDDASGADAGNDGGSDMDSGDDESPEDAGRDAYVWMPMGGSGGSSGSGGGGGTTIDSGLNGRMCAEPRDYLPSSLLPRCSADTATCIAGCMAAADAEACRDACIEGDATPPEPSFGLNCAACIYLTLFACIDQTDCHDGVAEVFCCIEDECPTGSPDGCSEQQCGGEIEAALTCGYFAEQECVELLGDTIGQCFDLGDGDAGL